MKITAHMLRVFPAFAADVSNSFGSPWEAVFSLNQLAENVSENAAKKVPENATVETAE